MLALIFALALTPVQDPDTVQPTTPQPTIIWASPNAEVPPAPAPAAAAPVALPEWALADPYAWERAECSPLVRGDEPLETCQSRVRVTLTSVLGDKTPAGLRAQDGDEDCARMAVGTSGSYAAVCGAARERLAASNDYARTREARADRCNAQSRRYMSPADWNRACGSPVDTGPERDIDQLRGANRD